MNATNQPTKPPYSRNGRLQLCSRCNQYCSRRYNLCPTCDRRDEGRDRVLARIQIELPTFQITEKTGDERHFIGTVGNHGYFVVWNDRMVLDRVAYREIATEAKSRGIERPYFIYGRICTYSGPGIEFMQIAKGGGT